MENSDAKGRSVQGLDTCGTPSAVQVIRPLPDKEITVHMYSLKHHEGNVVFLVGHHDIDFEVLEERKIKEVLDGGVKGSVLNGLGKITVHQSIQLNEKSWSAF